MNKTTDRPEEQINLLAILESFFRIAGFIKTTVYKKRELIIAGLLAGMAAGGIYYVVKPKLYKVSMLVTYNKLTKRTYAEIITRLNTLTGSGLATELQIPAQIADDIAFIAALNINGEELEKDTSSKVNQPFRIEAGLFKNASADTIGKAILSYLNNRPYFKKLSEIDRRNNMERLAFIEKELNKLDTLKTGLNHFLGSSKVTTTIYNNAMDPAGVYAQSNNLAYVREQAQRALYVDNDAVSLIDGFKKTDSYQSRSLLNLVCIMGFAGLFAASLLALFMEIKIKLVTKRRTA